VAGVAITLRYEWRGFRRRMLRRRQVRFYLTVLTLGGAFMTFTLPALLSQASGELAAGQTASIHRLLIGLCVLWLAVLSEGRDGNVTSQRLRRFPLDVPSLIAIRLLSLWFSPIVWMATIASVMSLSPFLSARHPLLGSLCAVLLFAATVGLGMSVSALPTSLSTGIVVAVVGIASFVSGLATVSDDWASYVRTGLAMINPGALVTTGAMAVTPFEVVIPLGTLALGGATVWWVFLWAFPRSLEAKGTRPSARRSRRVTWLPGRFGPLIQKEHRSVITILDLWMGVLPVLAATALSFSALGSATLRLSALVITCALNVNVTSNCLGLDRPAGLTRYLIFPLRGRDLLLAKNMGLAGAVAVQVAPLLVVGIWKGGVAELGAALIVAGVSLLGHLAWGNIVSVFEPRRAEPYGFVQGTDLVTTVVSMVLGGAPGVAVIMLLLSASPLAALAIAAIVLGTMASYYRSLGYAGASLERRFEIISRQLA